MGRLVDIIRFRQTPSTVGDLLRALEDMMPSTPIYSPDGNNIALVVEKDEDGQYITVVDAREVSPKAPQP